MSSINKIESHHIQQLNDKQLVDLLKTLLYSERSKYGITATIDVSSNINAPDDGCDGYFEWEDKNKKTTWLSNNMTIFQCKATNLSPKQCELELLIRNSNPPKLKPHIENIVKNDGEYILFTTQSCNLTMKDQRVNHFHNTIQSAGFTNFNKTNIKVFGADEIADWTNQSIKAVIRVQKYCGMTRSCVLITWDEWEQSYQYHGFFYQNTSHLLEKKKILFNILESEFIVRVIGQSGIGKTRFILEIFRNNNNESDIESYKQGLVYYDLGKSDMDTLINFLTSHRNQLSGILVVDNCDEVKHKKIIEYANSSFKIITIDFGYDTKKDSNRVIYFNPQEQKEVVEKMIETSLLSPSQQVNAIQYCEGFPQMAVLVNESIRNNPTSNTLLTFSFDEDFLKKIVFGRHDYNQQEYDILKACTVFTHFGFIDDRVERIYSAEEKNDIQTEMNYVCEKICVSNTKINQDFFYQTCQKFKDSGILEQRGTYIMVRPVPLAVSLADQWYRNISLSKLQTIFEELIITFPSSSRHNIYYHPLIIRMLRRLEMLNESDKAKNFVKVLIGDNASRLQFTEFVNTPYGSEIFRNIATIDIEISIQILQSIIENVTKEELRQQNKEVQRNFVDILEKLCFPQQFFSDAAKLLAMLAVSEIDDYYNNATDVFTALFPKELPGTEVNFEKRIEILQWALVKNDDDYTRLVINAISSGFSQFNSRMCGAERHGTRVYDSYEPYSEQEISDYWHKLIEMLTMIICNNDSCSDEAKNVFEEICRPLVYHNGIDFKFLISSIERINTKKGRYWAILLEMLYDYQRNETNISPQKAKIIEELIELCLPKTLDEKIDTLVLYPKVEYEATSSGDFIYHDQLRAEKLAEELVNTDIYWKNYLPRLLEKQEKHNGRVFDFGRVLGQSMNCKSDFLDIALKSLELIPNEKQNSTLIGAFLYGANDPILNDKYIEQVSNVPSICIHTFYLTLLFKSYNNIEKLFLLVDENKVTIQQFNYFVLSSIFDAFIISEMIQFFDRLCSYGIEGKKICISIILQRIDKNNSEIKNYLLKIICSENIFLLIDHAPEMQGALFHDFLAGFIKDDESDEISEIVKNISEQIIDYYLTVRTTRYIRDDIIFILDILFSKPYFKQLLNKIFAPYFLKNSLLFEIKFPNINGSNFNPGRIFFSNQERIDIVFDWCQKTPQFIPMIAKIMPLKKGETWHPFAKKIIDEFGNDSNVLNKILENLDTFGYIGSAEPYFEQQKNLFEQLKNHPLESVRNWAKQHQNYCLTCMERERIKHENYYLY